MHGENSRLSDRSAQDFGIVVVQPRCNATLLVHLFCLGCEERRLLTDLGCDGLVLANDTLTDTAIERVEEIEETGRDALLV